jgi:ADP-ribose pyrophosphatase
MTWKLLMRDHGPWKILKSEQMYGDPWIQLFRDQVQRPDGKAGTYATVHLKAGVCVVAMDHVGTLHLTKEFHYAVGRVTIEGVSGGIECDESSALAATREMAEELGITAGCWTRLGTVDPFTAAVLSPVDLYLAEDLTFNETNPEGTELIEHVTMTLDEAVQGVYEGVITHAPTCIIILRIALQKQLKLPSV